MGKKNSKAKNFWTKNCDKKIQIFRKFSHFFSKFHLNRLFLSSVFCFFLSSCLICVIFERDDILKLFSKNNTNWLKKLLICVGYWIGELFLYSLIAFNLKKSNAVVMNLNLLTSDFFSSIC